jgi:solute carrier family 13 (sodium-dependent dicarboxylate transporter), member 2/3/5
MSSEVEQSCILTHTRAKLLCHSTVVMPTTQLLQLLGVIHPAVVNTAMSAADTAILWRAAVIATLCLVLWLTGWVRVWIPTIVLWIATPLLLGTIAPQFGIVHVLQWSIDPVLALFLAGFAFAGAARTCGVDDAIARQALRVSRGSPRHLIVAAALSTVLLAMWMSNVAAAALMLNAFKPIWGREPVTSGLRRALLLAIALAADLGGMATPVGTGANGIALAAVEATRSVTFLHWMVFGVPIAFGMTGAAIVLVLRRFQLSSDFDSIVIAADPTTPSHRSPVWLSLIFAATILLWLTAPWHHIPEWCVALAAVVMLVLTRLLGWREIAALDWGTLLLVAGGIGLGALLEQSGLVSELASRLPLVGVPRVALLFGLCLVSALLSALMSNTATAALLIPLAATVSAAPSTAILVAIAASLGMPFVISTPPNAMAVSSGLRATDLLWPGLILMLSGCALVALTGPWILSLAGIP